MKDISVRLLSLLFILFSTAQVAYAAKVQGLGISPRIAGDKNNHSIASANARNFIAEQVQYSYFQYHKTKSGFVIQKQLSADVKNVKIKKVYNLGKNGIAVIAEATMQRKNFANAQCRSDKKIIKTASELAKFLPELLEKNVTWIINKHYKKKTRLSGVSFVKALKIKKLKNRRFQISASVCVAKVR